MTGTESASEFESRDRELVHLRYRGYREEMWFNFLFFC